MIQNNAVTLSSAVTNVYSKPVINNNTEGGASPPNAFDIARSYGRPDPVTDPGGVYFYNMYEPVVQRISEAIHLSLPF